MDDEDYAKYMYMALNKKASLWLFSQKKDARWSTLNQDSWRPWSRVDYDFAWETGKMSAT